MNKEIFSEIPMRTWNWLGVNEATVDKDLLVESQKLDIDIEAAHQEKMLVEYRKESYGIVNINIGENASLKLTQLQLMPQDCGHVNEINVVLEKKAKLQLVAVETGAKSFASKVNIILKGDKSQADVSLLYFGDGDRSLDLNYVLEFQGRKTVGNLEVYGGLMGASQKIFRGTLDFKQGSKQAKGYEKENVVVLSSGVRNRSVPIMLSGEDDVVGNHAVSSGKINEDKLHYLMSRGLSPAEARKLVLEAAFNPVLELIDDEALRQEIDSYIKERLENE
ncbi:MAG: SufD family Fe-S cluster assembly protein [Anaerovibrio sp.]|uniref:SufD family Fe-S cluster assembly protein n=1 Tax=Anaerovibrio sp. TaxID=1872532 RepID=UPI001B145B4D|nr:SufD family Fe-S cluster assembly protein [Anaerovibrio sp.]MBO6245771.1 SufD family Fe-S cluster assembly protein [Anaerovibrio sp.]